MAEVVAETENNWWASQWDNWGKEGLTMALEKGLENEFGSRGDKDREQTYETVGDGRTVATKTGDASTADLEKKNALGLTPTQTKIGAMALAGVVGLVVIVKGL